MSSFSIIVHLYSLQYTCIFRSIDNDKVLRGQPIDPRRGKFQTDTARAKHAQFMNQDKQDGRPKAADKGRRLQSLPSKKESHGKNICTCLHPFLKCPFRNIHFQMHMRKDDLVVKVVVSQTSDRGLKIYFVTTIALSFCISTCHLQEADWRGDKKALRCHYKSN
jgi:hypothetical protein